MRDNDPRDEIARIEEQIEELAGKIESCRKFILASRIATAAGGIVLGAMLFGVIRFDPGAMAAAMAALPSSEVASANTADRSAQLARFHIFLPVPALS